MGSTPGQGEGERQRAGGRGPQGEGERQRAGGRGPQEDTGAGRSDRPADDLWRSDPTAHDEFDSPAEVDAVFRTQRRISIGYFAVFVGGLLLVPLATFAADWWAGRLSGWATGFVVAGVALYVFFVLLALSATSLADSVERRMLGTPLPDDESDA